MYDTWIALAKYKMLSDRVNELKMRAWLELPPSEDIQVALEEAEAELEKFKVWIDLNYETKKLD